MLGVGGGIAAYKAVELARLLVSAGAHVIPVLTESARKFVGEVTFSAIASEPVVRSLWDGQDPIPHTTLGQKADLLLVAPATADLMARVAHGLASDLLTATVLASRAPLLLAPAMHTEMWENAAVVANVQLLRSRGVHFVGPSSGELAGGDCGMGRLADPASIVAAVEELFEAQAKVASSGSLVGRTVLVSAGGTREMIDPVRFLANRSSGRQGHAIAAEALKREARVILVTSSSLAPPKGATVLQVQSAAEMDEALSAHLEAADLVIMAAAVADFRPIEVSSTKLDRAKGALELRLEPVEDILVGLTSKRRAGQVFVGFAAEVDDLERRAAAKLVSKGADLIVANDISVAGIGFESADNAVVIVGEAGVMGRFGRAPKEMIASAVLDAASSLLKT